jgi:dTDP-glucose pyrophosphorylase
MAHEEAGMRSEVRQGIVLAAGRGTRLQPLSRAYPKPLLPVCNKPIMQHQIEAMRDAGIEEIAIVIGPGGAPIVEHFGGGNELGVRISYIEDPEPAGIAASLARAEPWVRGPAAVFLGDIFLALTDLAPALEPVAAGAAASVIVRHDRPEAIRRNFAVLTDGDGRVRRVIEKPDRPPTTLKGCGVYVFTPLIFEAIRRTPRSPIRNEYEITDALQIFIDLADEDGRAVHAAEVVRWDVNVTYPADLLACNLRLLRESQIDRLVGATAWISDHAQLHGSIVGDHAVVDADGPARLEKCLVLPHVRVTHLAGLIRHRIFGEGVTWAADDGS